MRKQLFILAGILSCLFSFAQIVNIPDANFKAYLVGNPAINTNGDNEIQVSEAIAFTGEIDCSNKGISLLLGIEYFTEITGLNCSLNSIQQLDLSNNKKLINLNCSGITVDEYGYNEAPDGQIEILNLNQNTNLKKLICSGNRLTNLDISKNLQLQYLDCSYNRNYNYNNGNEEIYIRNLDTSKNTNLRHLDVHNNQISTLDISKNIELEFLNCNYNKLSNLNLSYNYKLKNLQCKNYSWVEGSNLISSLDLTNNVNLETLNCSGNNLTNLDISRNSNLKFLDCKENKLVSINIFYNSKLLHLDCGSNEISSLNLIYSPQLEYVNCSYNQLTSINLSQNINLKNFGCHGNQLSQLNVTANTKLEGLYCTYNNLTELDVSKNILLKSDGLYCYGNKLTKLDVSHNPQLVQVWAIPNYDLKELNLKNGNQVRVNFWIVPDTLHALAPKLFCVEVDDVNWYYQNAPYLLDYIGQEAVYSTNCNLTLATNQTQKSQTKIYPNPVKNILTIQTEDKLQKVEIFSTTGQLLKTSFVKETNVANLPKGNYVAKITTDKGVQTEKIIKE
ncbi:T9SS type A sorting domain-containing protein [Epilithonimonas xixisoli]|uniref:Putative secreted protein (Por secretion system target) n=1 Tax=Epilithonimonas xixisoli TaxID=1476462 RepID=A0A4R8I7H5_9FLAO|nr:T9SS type A sorting domain-containing protein [Epilithonimonas xixisoli]TDX84395.1 putative secreted protein (Por secretion system target) [Epilithonimonas xixisoli]